MWQITTASGQNLYYVGRTGDASSMNAQSPFNRMSAHLGFNAKSNVLRKRLGGEPHSLDLDQCKFQLVAYGPILMEEQTGELHNKSRDIVAALEKALADAMSESGYKVINEVRCLKPLDSMLFQDVRNHFAQHFSRLK